MNILKTIKKEESDFETESIEIVKGFNSNQKDTLNRIYLYYNSKYESGEKDDQGDKKYFDNINRSPCNVGTKEIDFDTKHIRIQTAGGGSPLQTWFFERDLKFWMKDKKFGQVLNRLFHELPIFGSVVLKIIDGTPYFVDLRNFIVEQNADTLSEANYITEVHNYVPVEFRRIGKKKNWDNIEGVIESFRESKKDFITVYERYGEIEEEDEKGNKTYPYKRIILADVKSDDNDSNDGMILNETEVDSHPYREFHWEKIPGRWLGVGRVEVIFDPQIRINEISNQQVKSSYFSTLRLWQTRDEGVNRNLLTDVENGEILNVDDEITQVDMADRNLAYYTQEIDKWLGNRDELTFARDVLRGERAPTSSTLGAVQIAAGQAGSYFDKIRQSIAMAIKDLLYEIIIPQFEKENNSEHTLRIAGEDLDKLNNLLIENKTRTRIFEIIKSEKRLPTLKEFDLLKGIIADKIKAGKEQLVKIPKEFYKNLKYKIDIDIVGEAIDTRTKSANILAALQAITADPTLLTDPLKKKFFYRFLEQGGISPIDFQPEQETSSIEGVMAERSKGAGGGVSRPSLPQGAVAGTKEATL